MKTFALLVIGCLVSTNAWAAKSQVDVVNGIKLPKNVKISSIAGEYKSANGDTAKATVTKGPEDKEYTIEVEYVVAALGEYYGGDSVYEYNFDGATADGVLTFSEEVECDDSECWYGTKKLVFTPGKDGKYSLRMEITFGADIVDGWTWEEDEEPTPAQADAFCQENLVEGAKGDYSNGSMYCNAPTYDLTLQQQ